MRGFKIHFGPSASSPLALAAAAVIGTSNKFARADHVHPTTGLAGLNSNTFDNIQYVIRASDSIGFALQLTADTSVRFAAYTGGRLEWGPGNAGRDTNLKRLAAGVLGSDHKIVATQGLGCGNSAAATTLGSVVKKMEVFDASGNSLGFVPIYNSIT